MTSYQRWALLLLVILIQSSTHDCSVIVKRDMNEGVINGSHTGITNFEKRFLEETEERNLEQEILTEINHLSTRKQRQIFNDLEKQQLEKLNTSFKTLTLSESESLSPLNVEELKNIRNTIKTSNSSLPPIRNKRTLNFLLYIVARAMGYTLTPTNPDAEWIPRSQPTPAQPCATPAPPCATNPPSGPPPCAMPPSTPPCPGSGASTQPATIPPNQIDANTINYPYRPLRTIPLFNFAPLPPGVRVPYPPLLQPPVQQSSSCPPQRPPSPCGATPGPSPSPCMPSPPPRPTTPPCGAAPSPPPCGTTPAPRPPPCKPTPSPPCGTSPAPRPPPPCASTPAPPSPCATTPSPPSPCGTPCGNSPPPPAPSQPPKKGSILLEYDDPVRIQIFSNEKKYLPASGNIFSGHDDDEKKDFHSLLAPGEEKKDEDYEEKEEMEEEHFEEEEEDDTRPEQLKRYEEEDEKIMVNEEEDESETKTNLSIVKKPSVENKQDMNGRKFISSRTADESDKKDEKGNGLNHNKVEKSMKVKKPKTKKKWVRIVKKQRRKTKTDSSPHNSFQNMTAYSSDSFPVASQTVSKFYGKRNSRTGFDSFEKDISDYSGDSSIDTSEDVTRLELKKVLVKNDKALNSPDQNRRYEFNVNPYHFLEPEEARRQKLEKAVERYVEDYVEKQLGDELIKNTGVPKTTVFEFAPKNGPKIQTITTTVAKTNRPGNSANVKFRNKPETPSLYKAPIKPYPFQRSDSQEENFSRRGDASYESFAIRK